MASEPLPCNVDSLPAEIWIHILSLFPTKSLLPLAAVNRHFHALVLGRLHDRLTRATTLPEHHLILEWYPPSAQHSTPYLLCEYLGTGSLDKPAVVLPTTSHNPLSLGEMAQLYCRFRPVQQEENRRPRRRYPRRPSAPQPLQQDSVAGSVDGVAALADVPDPVTQDVHLDEGVLFLELRAVTNLGKVGPKRGLYHSCVNVIDKSVRVRRHWLAARADAAAGRADTETDEHEAIIWADPNNRVGLRCRVTETTDCQHNPLLAGPDEDPPASYRLEYEELTVQARWLLLKLEESEGLELADSGKAIVFT